MLVREQRRVWVLRRPFWMNKSLVDFEIDLRGIEVLRKWKSIKNACGGDDS